MRLSCIALLTALLLPACGGPDAGPLGSEDPTAAFAAFPSPLELNRGGAADEPVSKGVSTVILMSGGSFTEDPPSSNVSRMGDECWLYGQTLELTYAYFELAGTVLQGGEYFTHVLVEIDWEYGNPQPPEGMYIGMPDYERDAWHWLGPVTQSGVWMDISDLGLRGNVGTEHVIVVAFHLGLLAVEQLAFRHTSLDHTEGNEWLYYEHDTPDVPGAGTSISRARPDGSEIDHLFVATPAVALSRPVIATGDSDRLAFARSEDGVKEIWRSELDGSAPAMLLAIDGESVLPVGWHPDGSSFLFLRGEVSDYDLWARDIGEGVNGILHPESEVVWDAVWDTSNDYLYSAIVVNRGTDTNFHYIWSEGPLPVTEPSTIIFESLEHCVDDEPAPYAISDGTGGSNCGFVFTHHDGEDWMLYRYPAASDAESYPEFYLESSDQALYQAAVSPDGTRIALLHGERGEYEGTLLVTDFLDPDLDTALEIAQHVQDVVWYDPDY